MRLDFRGGAEGAWLKGMVPRMSGVEHKRPLWPPEDPSCKAPPLLLQFPDFLGDTLPTSFPPTHSAEAGRSCPEPLASASAESISGRDLERLRAAWASEDEVGASGFPQGESEEESLLEKDPLPTTTIPLSGDWLESLLW